MAWVQVDVVVDGALERDVCFDDLGEGFQLWLGDLENSIGEDGPRTEVYIVEHQHSEDIDCVSCACVQYLTDHKPAYVFPAEE